MIKRYSDHSANERTFLAWVRTAIAVMAFGFLIEKFDLFLVIAAAQTSQSFALHGQRFANAAGLGFILLGVTIIVIAGIRFIRTARNIDSDQEVPSTGAGLDLSLAVLLALLGVSLFLYMSRAVLPTL